MIGGMSRHVHTAHPSTTAGKWKPQGGVEIRGRKVAILGFGRIGQNLCQKLSHGFGMEVTGVDIVDESVFADQKDEIGYANYTTDRDAAIADADYVCLLYTSPSPRDATLSRMPSSA